MVDDTSRRPIGLYVACYALYVALIAFIVFVVFYVLRNTLTTLVAAYIEPPWARTNYVYLGMVLLTMVSFVAVLAAEPYLRKGAEKNLLLQRFGKMALPFAIAGVLGLLLRAWVRMG